MSNRTSEPTSGLHAGPIGLRDAVDLWGPDLSKWPDIAHLRHAREALLSDRGFRAYRDGAIAADRRLLATAAALDDRIASKGSVARIADEVLAKVEPRHSPRYSRYSRFAAVAAVIVIAGLLGGASGWMRPDIGEDGRMTVVQLDPLLFGPAEIGF
ncbi:hypothetical protein C3941_09065 [Kaistia algarum]|uniref:hypothetical protein n=1 Tax=Kaistia algarum TaxID=2083279 RepID=UPI000CE75F73|nr:hypothetical protein [Kaistia algarum]MCX5512210.1 hypothetical protein [Kaistia algarum]PPE80305.1 hypothetical protein C3941_09065 [Kaistia algarum]